jgi:hypothetical protein
LHGLNYSTAFPSFELNLHTLYHFVIKTALFETNATKIC